MKYNIFLLFALTCNAMEPIIEETYICGSEDLNPIILPLFMDLGKMETPPPSADIIQATLMKTHQCNACQKSFKTETESKNHFLRKHSGTANFKCIYKNCPAKYSTKASLNLHVTRNHREKRYQCFECLEKFALPGDLNQHLARSGHRLV